MSFHSLDRCGGFRCCVIDFFLVDGDLLLDFLTRFLRGGYAVISYFCQRSNRS